MSLGEGVGKRSGQAIPLVLTRLFSLKRYGHAKADGKTFDLANGKPIGKASSTTMG
jgi:hypothetical protein